MIKILVLLKAGGLAWLPILISHLFNKTFLVLDPSFFTPGVFLFRFHFFFEKLLFVLAKGEMLSVY